MFKIPNSWDMSQLLVLTTLSTGAGRLEQSHRLVRGSGAHRPAEGSSIPTKNCGLRLGVTMAIIYRYG